jgi:MYXO-CTERM domain-containing protein
LVGGNPLLGFASGNLAADFQGNGDGGDDVALFPDDGTLNLAPGGSFSLEAWVKGAPTQEAGAPIFAKGIGTREQFAVDVVGNNFRFYVRNGANPDAPSVLQTSVGPNNTWQHVVAVFDAAEGLMRVYVDGAQAPGAVPIPPATIIDNLHEISVGARQSASGPYDFNFDGLIDEVAVYKYALTPEQIAAHYQSAFTPVPEPSAAALSLAALGLFAAGRVVNRRRR